MRVLFNIQYTIMAFDEVNTRFYRTDESISTEDDCDPKIIYIKYIL